MSRPTPDASSSRRRSRGGGAGPSTSSRTTRLPEPAGRTPSRSMVTHDAVIAALLTVPPAAAGRRRAALLPGPHRGARPPRSWAARWGAGEEPGRGGVEASWREVARARRLGTRRRPHDRVPGSELLRRSADACPTPCLDVGELRGQGRAATAPDVDIARGSWPRAAVGRRGRGGLSRVPGLGDYPRNLEPAALALAVARRAACAVEPAGTRPLVYATGSTVHVGDETFDAGGAVRFLDVTDAESCSDRRGPATSPGCEFTDGLPTTRAIGRVRRRWPGDCYIMSS